MLTTDILPVAQKLKEQARNMAKEEESFQQRKRTRHADGEDTSTIQEVTIVTARIRRMGEGNVLTRVCPSVCPRGGVSPQSSWGGGGSGPAGGGRQVQPGGCQSSVQLGGGQVQLVGGCQVQPGGSGPAGRGGSGPARGGGQVQLAGGWGGQVQPGRGGQVQPAGGGSGPAGRGGGGLSQDRTTEWVVTTRRAVCLLRSRRRNFLLVTFFGVINPLLLFKMFCRIFASQFLLFYWALDQFCQCCS